MIYMRHKNLSAFANRIVLLFICAVIMNAEAFPGKGNNNRDHSGCSTGVSVKDYLVYVGTYTPKGTGIYIYKMNPATGALKYIGVSPAVSNPSYVALQPDKKLLFCVNEKDDGALSSFRIKDSCTLEFINSVPSNGSSPCYVSVDNSGNYLLAANYSSGSLTSVPINPDGSLGKAASIIRNTGKSINEKRQESAHAHSIVPYITGNYVYSADLGADLIYCYKIDTVTGQLIEISKTAITPGSGPRHMAFHQNGKWLYQINEMKGTIGLFLVDSVSGALNHLQTYPIFKINVDGSTAADIHITPSGRFLYASVRDPENTIVAFSINQQDGSLTPVGNVSSGGNTPRNFAIDPSGTFLFAANQNSDSIITFRIDPDSGQLKQVGDAVSVPSPVCIKFMTQ
jgi:6-phosphogluconolactonase